jgi:chemotaxis protein methyltransferase CheR
MEVVSSMVEREFVFSQQNFDFLRSISNKKTGIVVTDDKFNMFYARLSRRLRKLGLADFDSYCDLIRNDPNGEEMIELVNAVTTNLTSFFRENHHFEYLSKTIVPEMVKNKPAERKIRIWSAGCSTGEEPYSLGITLHEALAPHVGWNAEILATDIDSNVLAKAASGVYSGERVDGLDSRRLQKWFMRGKGANSGMVRLKPEIMGLIRFGQLNLMEDWRLEQPQDVIFCRNVIIYFDKVSKTKLVERFADNIKEGGYLFIGHSESLFKLTDRFELIGKTIYRKIR